MPSSSPQHELFWKEGESLINNNIASCPINDFTFWIFKVKNFTLKLIPFVHVICNVYFAHFRLTWLIFAMSISANMATTLCSTCRARVVETFYDCCTSWSIRTTWGLRPDALCATTTTCLRRSEKLAVTEHLKK